MDEQPFPHERSRIRSMALLGLILALMPLPDMVRAATPSHASAAYVLAGMAGTRAPQGPDRIILLGTKGGPAADPERSEPASLLVVGDRTYLIDAGAGVAHQIARAGFSPPDIHTMFLTHLHIDHSAGLEPLIALDWIGAAGSGKTTVPFDIYGPPATDHLITASLDFLTVSERIFRAEIPAFPPSEGMFRAHIIDHNGEFYSDAHVRVTAVENTHFGAVSAGRDGKRDMSFSYRFDTPSGSVVFTGDTGPSPAVTRLAKGADVLVSEVCVPCGGVSQAGSPVLREVAKHMGEGHLTPEEVGKMAAAAGVDRVVLSHIVAQSTPEMDARMKEGVTKYFKGSVAIGKDLMVIDLPHARD